MPSERVIRSAEPDFSSTSRKRVTRRVEIRMQIGISFLMVSDFIERGWIRAARPRIKRMLRIFEPMTFPRTISVLPEARALIETASSGAEVPKAIIVKPIRVLGMRKLVAVEEAPSTKRSAPLIKRTKPIIRRKI